MAKAGLAMSAADSVQLATGETVSVMSGQDAQFVSNGQMRVHSGQAIGLLGGVVKPGESSLGLQLVAAGGAIDVQAQAGTMAVQARDEVNVISANAQVDWSAAKSISLSTAGGANITISGGNITVQCPGKITIHAGVKSFVGPERIEYPMPYLPVSNPKDVFSNRLDVHDLFVQHEFSAVSYAAKLPTGKVVKGVLDEHGRSRQLYAGASEEIEILVGESLDEWGLIADIDPAESDDDGWA
jgi:uncharacterized protein (DUF2345 family)